MVRPTMYDEGLRFQQKKEKATHGRHSVDRWCGDGCFESRDNLFTNCFPFIIRIVHITYKYTDESSSRKRARPTPRVWQDVLRNWGNSILPCPLNFYQCLSVKFSKPVVYPARYVSRSQSFPHGTLFSFILFVFFARKQTKKKSDRTSRDGNGKGEGGHSKSEETKRRERREGGWGGVSCEIMSQQARKNDR